MSEDRSASHRRVYGMVHWDQGVSADAEPSPAGSTGSLSDQETHPMWDYLTLAALMGRPPEGGVTETASEKTVRACGKGQLLRRYLLPGSLVFVLGTLLAAITLLSFYVEARAHLDGVYEERDMLYRNQSHGTEAVENCKERNLALLNNLSSLAEAVTYLRERTLSPLLLAQTARLLETERHRAFYRVELRNYMDLRDLVTANYVLIPRDGAILQRCQATDQGTVCPFCPAMWHLFGSSCYLPSPQTQSWQESLQGCRKQGAHLAVIGSPEEQEFLQNLINKTAWIGLSDRHMEAEWTWVDGTPYNSTPKFWNERQPDNAGNEDCVVLVPGSGWSDEKCRKAYGGVCEHRVGELRLPADAISN